MTTPSTSGNENTATPSKGVSDTLSDLLECSVCLESLGSDHKVLPCQHTFCLSCLEDLAAKKQKGGAGEAEGVVVLFLCPECRYEVTTPISTLPTNVILNRILSGLNQTPTTPPTGAAPQIKRAPPPPLAIGKQF